MKNKPDLEAVYEIWPNTGDGWHVQVGPDRDGLGCVEIRYRDDANKIVERMSFPPEFALLVGEAMTKSANDLINKKQ